MRTCSMKDDFPTPSKHTSIGSFSFWAQKMQFMRLTYCHGLSLLDWTTSIRDEYWDFDCETLRRWHKTACSNILHNAADELRMARPLRCAAIAKRTKPVDEAQCHREGRADSVGMLVSRIRSSGIDTCQR